MEYQFQQQKGKLWASGRKQQEKKNPGHSNPLDCELKTSCSQHWKKEWSNHLEIGCV